MPSARDCLLVRYLGIGGHVKFTVRTETSRGHREARGAHRSRENIPYAIRTQVVQYRLRKAQVGCLLTVAVCHLHTRSTVVERVWNLKVLQL
ncbi:hypothetical protein EVAR_2998_1 [Eumeta japonica]|uniref:Uncharacterized protein n=1 Tax=Eumeta variegata TaxID=151549 RepID=A0A4C1STM3_EUMVA|nr:hypothetical protein EVAR_2998_1 [Eumeta japonica]